MERFEPVLWGVDATTGLRVLATEHDNLRAALDWCHHEDASAGLRLASSLWWFWIRRGHLAEGSQWLKVMLDLAPEYDRSRASALMGVGVLARDRGDVAASEGDYPRAREYLSDALTRRREIGDLRNIAYILSSLGKLAR